MRRNFPTVCPFCVKYGTARHITLCCGLRVSDLGRNLRRGVVVGIPASKSLQAHAVNSDGEHVLKHSFRHTRSILTFCWPCIIVCQYYETNVTHFSFNLLRIKGIYMFRALLAHPQEVLHKRQLVYCVRIMSVGGAKKWNRGTTNWHTVYCVCACDVRAATLTEGFPCFFLSCKANTRV
jgi:hypothetical protein